MGVSFWVHLFDVCSFEQEILEVLAASIRVLVQVGCMQWVQASNSDPALLFLVDFDVEGWIQLYKLMDVPWSIAVHFFRKKAEK